MNEEIIIMDQDDLHRADDNLKEKKLRKNAIILYFIGYTMIGALVLTILCSIYAFLKFDTSSYNEILDMIIDYTLKFQIILDIIFLGIFIYLFRSWLTKDKNVFESRNKTIITILVSSAIILIVGIGINLLFEFLIPNISNNNQESLQSMIKVAPATLIFAALVFAPVVEEIIFRGAIFNAFYKKENPIAAILISGALFSLVHVIGSLLVGNLIGLIHFVSYFAVGIGFGFLYHKTRNLYICIGVHFINNLVAVLLMFLL